MQTRYETTGNAVEWVAVRPDSLINAEALGLYEVFASPIRDPIFNAGKTSHINVAGFMKELIVDDTTLANSATMAEGVCP